MALSKKLQNIKPSQAAGSASTSAPDINTGTNAYTSDALKRLTSSIPLAQRTADSLGLGAGKLGRMSEQESGMSAAVSGQALELSKGLSSAEMAAQKSQGLEAIGNQSKAAQRRLASMQAAQGVQGGAAVAQNMAVMGQDIAARGNLERDLLMNQFNSKMQGTALLSNVQQARDNTLTEAKQFNIAQSAKEKMIPLTIASGAQAADTAKYAADKGASATVQAAQMSSGGGGITVICTELGRQGIFDEELLNLDHQFGLTLPHNIMVGYHFLANPVVKLMQKSELMTSVIAAVAMPWAQHMAHVMNPDYQERLIGKCIMTVGKPICGLIGNILLKLGK